MTKTTEITMFVMLDLQAFANLNTQTTLHGQKDAEGQYIAGGADNDLSPEMKVFYDMELIEEAGAALVHDQFAQMRDIPQGGGKIIEFRKFGNLAKALTPLSEGVTPDGNKLHVTSFTSEVAQYGDYIVQSDVLELTSLDNTILEATKILGKQAGLTLDTVTRNAMQSGTNVTFCPKVVSGVETAVTERSDLDTTAMLTVDVINRVVAKLRANNVPTINGDYVAIIHPYVAYDLMTDPAWVDAHKYTTSENIYNGEIGKIGGVRFVQTSEAKIYKGTEDDCPTGLAVFGSLFFGEGAYGTTKITGGGLQTIVKQKGSAGTNDPLDQRSSVGWKAIKTAELLVPNYLVRVESCSKVFSASVEAN